MTEEIQEISLDGIIYARLRHKGQSWLLGSTNPAWKSITGTLPANPSSAELADLERRGIWLCKEEAPRKLAVICCGLGSGWPGMGRELYDNFPEARKSMNHIADMADWDLLALLDEDDLESISKTRKQIPHLFLLEYAQWRQFSSLGLAPSIMCGHSLGELVALCLAGVYDERAAWLLFEKRAEHIVLLEKKLAQETGMLAIHADESVVLETLAEWPSLSLANRNTPRQFIVGGPKDDLLQARKSLRKRHVPAMTLNVPLAFHNPAMRILRDFSLRRLRGLDMQAPRLPVLSNVTGGFYPCEPEEICRYIADLDENAVDWIGCTNTMAANEAIDVFLELGPGHTLTGLVEELAPGRITFAADRRETERDAMRAACARLFSLGLLDFDKIVCQKNSRPVDSIPIVVQAPDARPYASDEAAPDGDIKKIVSLIAAACGKDPIEITCDLDLRYDLALRSSSFPLLLQKAEKELGLHIEYENLLQVNTVGDLALAFLGREKKSLLPKHSRVLRSSSTPLRRFEVAAGNGGEAAPALLIYRKQPLINIGRNSVILLLARDPGMQTAFLTALRACDATVVAPGNLQGEIPFGCLEWIVSFECSQADLEQLPLKIHERFGRLDGILIIPQAWPESDNMPSQAFFGNFKKISPGGWILMPRRFTGIDSRRFIAEYSSWRGRMTSLPNMRTIGILDRGEKTRPDEIGDLVALELCYGTGDAFWARSPYFTGEGGVPQLFAEARDFPLVAPDHEKEFPGSPGCLDAISWFSQYADKELAIKTGGQATVEDLRPSRKLAAMLEGSQKLLPWLVPLGFSDIHFFNPVTLCAGAARECRLKCSSMFWMKHEKRMTRLVNCGLMARRLAANGRRLNDYDVIASGICYLAGEAARPEPMETTSDRVGPQTDLLPAYIEAGWAENPAQAKNLYADGENMWHGHICLEPAAIAIWGKEVYCRMLQMFDGLFEAARLVLAKPESPGMPVARWFCAGVGYLNFNNVDFVLHEPPMLNNLRFDLKTVWKAKNFMRFNGQVGDDAGKIFLVAHNLELEKI